MSDLMILNSKLPNDLRSGVGGVTSPPPNPPGSPTGGCKPVEVCNPSDPVLLETEASDSAAYAALGLHRARTPDQTEQSTETMESAPNYGSSGRIYFVRCLGNVAVIAVSTKFVARISRCRYYIVGNRIPWALRCRVGGMAVRRTLDGPDDRSDTPRHTCRICTVSRFSAPHLYVNRRTLAPSASTGTPKHTAPPYTKSDACGRRFLHPDRHV